MLRGPIWDVSDRVSTLLSKAAASAAKGTRGGGFGVGIEVNDGEGDDNGDGAPLGPGSRRGPAAGFRSRTNASIGASAALQVPHAGAALDALRADMMLAGESPEVSALGASHGGAWADLDSIQVTRS